MDLRTPIGLLFGAIGLLLVIFGFTHGGPAFTPTGVNIDLDWGAIMLLFGAFMLLLAFRARAREAASEETKKQAVSS